MKRGSSLWRSVICFLLCISLLFSYAVAALADQASEREGNQNYFSNQGKLVDDAFTMLPLGAVQPEEWLREQLLLQKEGLLGNMQDNYPIYSDSNGWRGGSGDTWEKGPYYFRGLTQTAFILDDEELKAKAMKWIDWTLDNQRENGFMGPSQDGGGTNKSWDWWPRMVVLLTLQDYYEATEYYGDPDERVLPFLENYFRYQLEHIDEWPLNQYWDEARGGDNIEVVLWLYNRLYDANNPDESAWLITLANKLYQSTYKWTDILQDTTSRQHVVNTTQGLKTPAVMYQITGAEKDKTALRYGIENYSIDHGRVDGLANADEAARENYPYRGTELCSISEGILSESISMRILGEGWIGDDLESLAYNSLPAAYSPDLRNQTYYQAQNQVMLTHGTHDFDQDHGDDIAFGAFSGFECCFPNGHMGWPKFVQSMWMATRDNGLAIVAYGPNTVTAKVADGKTAVFTQSTNYPFEETVTLTYSGDTAAFPLKLRIPEWCEGWTILLNGERVTGDVVNGYLTINRTFQKGDTIELVFPMQVELSTWYNNALSVKYGPLIFGVKVEEDWRDTDDFSITGYRQEVEPFTFKETYPASAWNYALVIDEDDIQGSFEVVRTDEVAAQPFNVSTAPITLKVTGQLVPDWKLMGNSVPEAPYSPLEADTSLQTEIELIPTGCTRMHINQIPWVGEAEDTVIREATTAETYTYEGEKTVQFDNVIVPDADDYTMVVTYSGSGDLTLNVNTKHSQTLNFPAGQTTVTVGNLEDLVTDSAFRFCYEHYNRIRFTGNAGVTIEKIEIIPTGTFDGPKVTSSSATMDSIKLTTNIDRADGFYTVYYGTESGNYTMTSEGHHERIAYLTGLEPDTTYYGQVEMRVNGVLTRTSEFTVTTLAEESGAADPWSVPGAFTDEFEDATASKDRWIVLGDSVVTYSGGKMNIGDSQNIKVVTGSENWQNYTVEATLNPGESGRDCGVMFRTTNASDTGPDAYNGYYVGVKEGAVIVGYADGGWNQMGSEIPAAIEKNQDCVLKVVVVGNQFAIFVDDVQVGSIITPSVEYASGQVGLRSYNNPFTCDTFTVRAVSEAEKALFGDTFVGFTDDFSDASASQETWDVYYGDDAQNPVTFGDGRMTISSTNNVKVVAGEESWRDYTVEATIHCPDQGSGSNGGVMFRTTDVTNVWADSYNGYYVGLGAHNGTKGVVVGYASVSAENPRGSYTSLTVIPLDYDATQFHALKVVVVGNSFAIFVDGQQVGGIITPPVEYTSGQVGLRSYEYQFACEDFTVRAVTEEEQQVFETGFVGFTDDFNDTDSTPWTVLGDTSAVTFDGEKMSVGKSNNIKVVAGDTSWTDYTVEGTFVGSEASVQENCGLMFRTTNATGENADSYNGYYVGLGIFGGVKGVVVGYGANSWNLIETIPFDYQADVVYRLRVAVVGNSFAIYVDDVLMGVVTDNRYAAGQVGVRSYEFPFTCDDFSVRAVSEEEKQDIASATSTLDTAGGTSFHEGAQIQFATLGGSYTYKIQYGTEPGVYTHEYVGLTSKHNPDKFSISGLTNGTTYYLRAVAMSGGEEIAWSDEVAVTPGESDNPQDEIANLQSLLTQAEAVAEKSNVLEDRIAYAKEVLGMSGTNRMDLTTAQASLQSAMNQNEHDLSEEEPGHTHTLTLEPAVAATCNAMGHNAYYTCSGCDDWFEDAEGKTVITDHSSVITDKDPNNHTGGTEIRDAKPATATKDGYTGDTYCLGCGAMLAKGQVIPATGGSGIILPILPVNPGTPSYELPFVDVPEGEWYYESVYYAWDAGLINGTSPTTFRPDNTLTVAEAIKLAAALHQLESEGKVTLRNGQVNWYDTYVAYAVKEGIIEAKYQRYTVSQMNAPATRREFVHILHGALDDYAAINAIGENAIPDVKTGDTYAAEIYDFYRAGILTGSNAQGTFHPESSIKRSEVAAILIRMYDPSMRLEKTL